MIGLVFALLLSAPSAQAGSGPWTLPGGARNLYLGWSQSSFSELQMGDDVAPLGQVRGTTFTAIGTLGLLEGIEAEVQLPWQQVQQMDRSAALCESSSRPRDFCAPSSGIGPFQATLKGRLLDEGALRPMTASVAAAVRSGTPTADLRDRITAVGDGQTDIGALVSVGRTASLREDGWYSASATLAYWYRSPLPSDADEKVPADQLEYGIKGLVAPIRKLGIGPVISGFHRLGGVEFSDLSPSDPNGFPSLDAAQLKAGGELLVTGDGGVSLSISALRTIRARNNPSDTTVLSLGVGWYAAAG